MQLRQHERFSSQGRRQQRRQPNEADDSNGDSDSTLSEDNSDDTDSSSDDNNDDDHCNNISNEGCSQGNLYIVMRLSFAVALLARCTLLLGQIRRQSGTYAAVGGSESNHPPICCIVLFCE